MMRRTWIDFPWAVVVLALVAVIATGCGGGSGGGTGTSSAIDLTGTWTGTWTRADGGASGPVTITIGSGHMGHDMQGNCAFGGSPCFEGGTFSGSCSGALVWGSILGGEFRVDCSMEGHAGSPDRMGGTYQMIVAGMCTGEHGSIEFERAASVTAGDQGSAALRIEMVGPPLTEWVATMRLESLPGLADTGLVEPDLRARGTFDAAGRAEAVLVSPPTWCCVEVEVAGQSASMRPAIVAIRAVNSPRSP